MSKRRPVLAVGNRDVIVTHICIGHRNAPSHVRRRSECHCCWRACPVCRVAQGDLESLLFPRAQGLAGPETGHRRYHWRSAEGRRDAVERRCRCERLAILRPKPRVATRYARNEDGPQ
jgi:hypothetical protein